MPIRLISYITGQEVFGTLTVSHRDRLQRLVAQLPTSDSFVLLCHANALVGLFSIRFEKEFVEFNGLRIPTYHYIQLELSATFLSKHIRQKLASPEFSGRPVFYRKQLLYLITRVLRFGSHESTKRLFENSDDRHFLGRLLLNYSNVLVPEDTETRSAAVPGSESSADELILQLVPTFEMDNPPYFDDGLARSLEYLEIFHSIQPTFDKGLDLDEYFKQQTGIGLRNYLFLLTAVYFHYLKFVTNARQLVSDPVQLNIDAQVYFSNLKLSDVEKESFFRLVAVSITQLAEVLKEREPGATRDEYDFTVFRKFPLVFLAENVFTCIDLGFLAEKVSSGLFRSIHNALPDDPGSNERKDDLVARKLSSVWGKVVEIYVCRILGSLTGFWPNVTLKRGKGNEEEIDGVFIQGDELILLETKGGTLSARAKYGGDEKLFDELNNKFGRKAKRKGDSTKGGVRQLVTDMQVLFPLDTSQTPSITGSSCPDELLNSKTVYPLLVVEERVLELDLLQWKLRSWFAEELAKVEIRRDVTIKPLLILPVEVLEWLEPHLREKDFSLLEFVKFCSEQAESPEMPFWEKDIASTLKRYMALNDLSSLRNRRLRSIWNDYLEELKSRFY